MNNLFIFAIFDQKAAAYLPPFFLPTAELATRTFTDCVNSDTHQFGKHPEDYTLYMIGDYDIHTGIIKPKSTHLLIGTGLQFQTPELSIEQQEQLDTIANQG